MRTPRSLVLFAFVLACTAFTLPARADSLTLTILNPNQSIGAGQTAEFDATVSAGAAATIFLNGDSYNVSGPFTLNDNDFFNHFPIALAPGQSFTGALFTLTSTATAGVSSYNGSFTIVGGFDGNALTPLATATFPVTPITATPEPSSLLLFATGTLGAVAAGRRRLVWLVKRAA